MTTDPAALDQSEIIALTAQLVAQASVSGSAGEAALGEWLCGWLSAELADCPAVEHWTREGLFGPPAANDSDMPRARAIVCFMPTASESTDCIALLAHYDTVSIDPYGPHMNSALDSAVLKQHFAASADPALREQALSPDWAFGRGWLDMKSGVAAVLLAFRELARTRSLPASLLLILTPDEEGQSSGIRRALPAIGERLSARGLRLKQLLNADYCVPNPKQPQQPLLYQGTTGKLLLGLSVIGAPAHASEPFAGVNAAALAAALASGLEQSPRLASQQGGRWLPPPVVLSLRADRGQYDVTAPQTAQLYVNILFQEEDPARLWGRIMSELRGLISAWDRQLRRRYNQHCSRSNQRPQRLALRPELLDLAALRSRPEGGALLAAGEPDIWLQSQDAAQQALDWVTQAALKAKQARPLVVASLLPPFYPAQAVSAGSVQAAQLSALAQAQGLSRCGAYPYISDMSFFAFEPQALAFWEKLAPCWFGADESSALAQVRVPVSNIGPLGYGAHSAQERVWLPQLRRLPGLLLQALQELARS